MIKNVKKLLLLILEIVMLFTFLITIIFILVIYNSVRTYYI